MVVGAAAYVASVRGVATEVCQDLGEFTEILDDVSVEMIPIRYH
jgi:hypothetical protein